MLKMIKHFYDKYESGLKFIGILLAIFVFIFIFIYIGYSLEKKTINKLKRICNQEKTYTEKYNCLRYLKTKSFSDLKQE